ncbi:glycoside hydrolase superfamily [Rhodofomes roseus]|uniref:glucan 1,3-beta-glucosidase n=1 Tax=Rhodofomes roseus TaxID=34475 RepID=A0ABQ8K8N5_9APHY|nr:glycoside hydrolase superfamily [Rhodofomes roseus]KAH9833448.1 glycoside hydrolase superfamily [Rhodofomes roseus]
MSSESSGPGEPGLAPPQPLSGDRASVGRADSYADSATHAPYVPGPGTTTALEPSEPSTPVGAYASPALAPAAAETSPFIPPATADPEAAAAAKDTNAGSKEALAGAGAVGVAAARPWYHYRRPWIWLVGFLALAAVVLVVVLPVWFVAVKPHRGGPGASGGAGGADGGAVTGGNGSTITTANGTTFTYTNNFGGYWVYDPADPFNNSARPNAWTPPLSEAWNFSTNRINGVNLGGLFVMEPFITPKYYQQYAAEGAIDEWTLDTAFRAKANITEVMEQHYSGFVTEQDIAEIAGAGLNWVRMPIPFWAIETWSDVGVANGTAVAEPFVARMCWQYILQVFQWARKYGIRVNLDLHTIPGSQNGYNHSGKLGTVNFLNGMMGIANAERALEYIRVITEFVTQPEYQPLIPIFSIVNEALLQTISLPVLTTFYLNAHWMVRNITGVGEGNGPYIAIHDGFMGTAYWAGFLEGSDRIILDTHPYFAFDNQPNNEPVNVTANGTTDASVYGGQWPQMACSSWGPGMNTSRSAFGVTIAGEFSNGINDCGLWVRGVNISAAYVGNCDYWAEWESWSDETKAGLKTFALASMNALGDWFFWTWKIDSSSTSGTVESPLWSYKLGLEQGWIPRDPREADGICESLGVAPNAWNQSYASYATGGAGANAVAASSAAAYGVWPPSSINNVPAASTGFLPQYTPTASVVSLPPASTYTAATVGTGSGWADGGDRRSAPTAIAGCEYPDAWNAVNAAVPTSGCGAVANERRGLPPPVVTSV